MGKIFKNMLPYWKWILVIVAFLVMQAFCDLSLPQYTSDIIDVGIMSSGVEHILPEEMTQEDFVSAQLFMTSREKKTFAACYKEPKKDGNYVRNCEEDTLDDMDESLLEPIVMVYQMSQMKESDIDEKALTGKMGTDGTQVDMKQLMQALASPASARPTSTAGPSRRWKRTLRKSRNWNRSRADPRSPRRRAARTAAFCIMKTTRLASGFTNYKKEAAPGDSPRQPL